MIPGWGKTVSTISQVESLALSAPPAPPGAALPPSLQDAPLYEIVDGQRVELPPMSSFAGWVASRLDQRLGPFADNEGLGTVVTETLFLLDARRNLRRRPDVAFLSI